MVSFFSENYYAYHYSNVFSNAFIFMVVLIIFSILLPFFTNIGVLDQFWKPITVYTDHPIVQFKEEFYIVVNGNKDFSSINNDVENLKSEPSERKIHISGMLNSVNNVKDIRFYIFFDYYMIEKVNVHIRSKAHFFYSSSEDFSSITADGDLVLKQNKGLVETYFIDSQGTNSVLSSEINEVKESPFTRDNDYYFEFKTNFVNVEKNGDRFTFDFTFNIPYYEDIFVQLPNYTNLKNKWVLYSILFFPTVFVCYKLMELAIENQIFKTRIKSDIPIRI